MTKNGSTTNGRTESVPNLKECQRKLLSTAIDNLERVTDTPSALNTFA